MNKNEFPNARNRTAGIVSADQALYPVCYTTYVKKCLYVKNLYIAIKIWKPKKSHHLRYLKLYKIGSFSLCSLGEHCKKTLENIINEKYTQNYNTTYELNHNQK